MGNIRVNGTKGIQETEFAVIPTIRIYYCKRKKVHDVVPWTDSMCRYFIG
ncbi:hypothetical protein Bca4012_071008 [Brassica carinata]